MIAPHHSSMLNKHNKIERPTPRKISESGPTEEVLWLLAWFYTTGCSGAWLHFFLSTRPSGGNRTSWNQIEQDHGENCRKNDKLHDTVLCCYTQNTCIPFSGVYTFLDNFAFLKNEKHISERGNKTTLERILFAEDVLRALGSTGNMAGRM